MYEVDPDGDLIIILHSSEEQFAPWDDQDDKPTVSPTFLECDATVETGGLQVTTDGASPTSSITLPRSWHFKVSSKHLILASPRFKKMLTGDWKEAKTVNEDGYRHVTLDAGFDPEALKLFLDIIHGRIRKVPKSLDLEMLAKVSILVDDLECHEEVELFRDIWLKDMSTSSPTEYSRDLVLWILVSSVFYKPELFEFTTRTAILYSTERIQTLGLPLRDVIVGK